MGFIKKIFKRKEGGTFLGNIIRGVASNYTGGILGSGAQMKKGPSVDQQVQEALAKQQSSMVQSQQPVAVQTSPADSPLAAQLNSFLKGATKDVGVQAGLDKNTKIYIAGGIVAVLLGVLLIKKS